MNEPLARIHVDQTGAGPRKPTCSTHLPYPARRCGYHVVRCDGCGLSVMISTAGRPDDPRWVRVNCKRPA